MSILQKHIAKEIFFPFIILLLVITSLVMMGDLFREMSARFVNRGLALGDMGKILLYSLPTLVTYTVPIALLFATLVAFVQLSQDSEIVAMRAAGIPVRKAFAPAILMGILTTMLLLALRVEIDPWARRRLGLLFIEVVLNKPTLVMNEQMWTSEVDNMRIFVGEIDNKNMLLRDVRIVAPKDDGTERTIVAESGRIYFGDGKKGLFLELHNGSIHDYERQQPEQYSTTLFGSMTIPADIEDLDRYLRKYHRSGDFRTKELSLGQIRRKLSDPSTDPEDRRKLLQQMGKRTALSFMPLALVLIGAPLGIIPHKARRFYGPAICAGLLFAYYLLLALGETIGEKNLMNPIIAMWLPNLFLGMTGIVLMVRAERR